MSQVDDYGIFLPNNCPQVKQPYITNNITIAVLIFLKTPLSPKQSMCSLLHSLEKFIVLFLLSIFKSI
uniref:Uncharacterized protein n=1 Tax=Anguilla anguilla TaxID=7936 RepID=A0A0E9WG31_ANGAN